MIELSPHFVNNLLRIKFSFPETDIGLEQENDDYKFQFKYLVHLSVDLTNDKTGELLVPVSILIFNKYSIADYVEKIDYDNIEVKYRFTKSGIPSDKKNELKEYIKNSGKRLVRLPADQLMEIERGFAFTVSN